MSFRPTLRVTPEGRRVIFTIAQGKRSFEEECHAGWAHNGDLPGVASRLDYLRELGMTNDPFGSIEDFRDVESINA